MFYCLITLKENWVVKMANDIFNEKGCNFDKSWSNRNWLKFLLLGLIEFTDSKRVRYVARRESLHGTLYKLLKKRSTSFFFINFM